MSLVAERKKELGQFANKVENNFGRMDCRTVKYARNLFDPIFTVKKDASDSLVIAEQ